MLQDKLVQQQQLKNFGRRSRKDQQGRDYICGCGKSYLSYPALYTHIKTKHDGLRPEGTFKVGLAATNKKTNSSTAQNSNNNSLQNDAQVPLTKPPFTIQIKSRLNSLILKSIEQLIKLQDLRILKQVNQQATGFTHPDNRIQKLQAGEALYEKYNTLVKQSESQLSDTEILNSFINLSSKSPLDTVLVSYLLAVGKYVSENMMQYYANFAKMFFECYHDHAEQIYQICYRNTYPQKQKDDNSSKCYEYSYPPSSSKYKNLLSSTYTNSYNGTFNSVQINIKQCKYCPIICQFFVRCYIATENDLEYFKSIMELICNDFCTWLYRKKLTVVEVGLNKKYQVYQKDMINIREKATNTCVEYPQSQPTNVEVQQEVSTKSLTLLDQKQKSKKKQRQKITRVPINSSGNKSKMAKNTPNKSNIKNQNPAPTQQKFYTNQQYENSQNHNNMNDEEQPYKIGHEMAHEQAGLGFSRERSGSIHQYINGHNFGEVDHDNIHETQHGQGYIGHGTPVAGRNVENTINEQEIQQYFSVQKL